MNQPKEYIQKIAKAKIYIPLFGEVALGNVAGTAGLAWMLISCKPADGNVEASLPTPAAVVTQEKDIAKTEQLLAEAKHLLWGQEHNLTNAQADRLVEASVEFKKLLEANGISVADLRLFVAEEYIVPNTDVQEQAVPVGMKGSNPKLAMAEGLGEVPTAKEEILFEVDSLGVVTVNGDTPVYYVDAKDGTVHLAYQEQGEGGTSVLSTELTVPDAAKYTFNALQGLVAYDKKGTEIATWDLQKNGWVYENKPVSATPTEGSVVPTNTAAPAETATAQVTEQPLETPTVQITAEPTKPPVTPEAPTTPEVLAPVSVQVTLDKQTSADQEKLEEVIVETQIPAGIYAEMNNDKINLQLVHTDLETEQLAINYFISKAALEVTDGVIMQVFKDHGLTLEQGLKDTLSLNPGSDAWNEELSFTGIDLEGSASYENIIGPVKNVSFVSLVKGEEESFSAYGNLKELVALHTSSLTKDRDVFIIYKRTTQEIVVVNVMDFESYANVTDDQGNIIHTGVSDFTSSSVMAIAGMNLPVDKITSKGNLDSAFESIKDTNPELYEKYLLLQQAYKYLNVISNSGFSGLAPESQAGFFNFFEHFKVGDVRVIN